MLAAVFVAGCGGTEREARPVRLTAGEVCGGELLNAGAVRALELLTGAQEFDPRGKGSEDVAAVAEHLAGGYAAIASSRGGRVCEAVPSDTANKRRVSVSFELQSELMRTGEQSESGKGSYWEYDLGRNALAHSWQAFLFFDCASPRLAGPDKAVPVTAKVYVTAGSEGDEPALRGANLALAHSAALAMGEELGCKDNGGLPQTLVLKQKAARTDP
ncbi:hypothetical protein ABZY44_13220 [Streptomyces sp. NPDC006544]|uniref:hypothetical protein n=1 Tax=Streptomyces sp. NPDC006544 TaxID=3154583 RepID=UPI00339F6EE8